MLRLQPERFIAGGETLGHDGEGRVVFVRGGLPGEDVSVELTEEKTEWARGVATEVHLASSERVEPPCQRRREGCGGCDWQHLAVAAQLPAKTEILLDALRRTGNLTDPDVRLGASVPASAYRTTIRVIGDEKFRASYREERSHDLVSAAGCLVAHPALEAMLEDLMISPDLEVTLRVSVATGEVTARWDERKGGVDRLPDEVRSNAGAMLYEEVAGKRFRVSAGSFFQSGPAAAELLIDSVKRAAPELSTASTVLDAYAGIGLFASAATSPDSKLITIETSKSALADCRKNLADRDVQIESGQVGRWRANRNDKIDVVIADPARSGLGRQGVGALSATTAPVLVLVSCDPVALARDAGLLAKSGYRHDGTEVLDLFPQTHHVEAVTRFVLAD